MNKEEILEASRRENKNQDVVEAEVIKQASQIAYLIGCMMCGVICLIQVIFTDTMNWGCWVVNFSILGTVFLFKSIKLKKRHEIILTILYYGFALFFAVGFAFSLRG